MAEEPEFQNFLCDYPFEGDRWCFEIKAASREDAEARLKAMPFAQVLGETMLSVKLPPLHRWFPWMFRGVRHDR